MENRRGFLKTLGKLGAAVGLTTVAASTLPVKGDDIPVSKELLLSQVRDLKRINRKISTSKANSPTPPKAKKVSWCDNHGPWCDNHDELPVKLASNSCTVPSRDVKSST